MRAGQLRHRGRIEQPVVTQNSHGESVTTWQTFASRRAMQVVQQASRELWYAQQVNADVTCLVRLRYIAGVTSAMRVVWDDAGRERVLYVAAPPLNRDGKHIETTLACTEKAGHGTEV